MSKGKAGTPRPTAWELAQRAEALANRRREEARQRAEAAERERQAQAAAARRAEEERRQRRADALRSQAVAAEQQLALLLGRASALGLEASPVTVAPLPSGHNTSALAAMEQALEQRLNQATALEHQVSTRRMELERELGAIAARARAIGAEFSCQRDLALARGDAPPKNPDLPPTTPVAEAELREQLAQRSALVAQAEAALQEAAALERSQAMARVAEAVARELERLEPVSAPTPAVPADQVRIPAGRLDEARATLQGFLGDPVGVALGELLLLAEAGRGPQATAALVEFEGLVSGLRGWRASREGLVERLYAEGALAMAGAHPDDLPVMTAPLEALSARWDAPFRSTSIGDSHARLAECERDPGADLADALAAVRAAALGAEAGRRRKALLETLGELGYLVHDAPPELGTIAGRPVEQWIAFDAEHQRGFALWLYTDEADGFRTQAVVGEPDGSLAEAEDDAAPWILDWCDRGLREVLPRRLGGEEAYDVAITESTDREWLERDRLRTEDRRRKDRARRQSRSS